MLYAYVKQLIVNGGGAFHVVRIGAESDQVLAIKRDMYIGDDWQDATEEEYNAQMGSVKVSEPVEVVEPTVEEVKEEATQ